MRPGNPWKRTARVVGVFFCFVVMAGIPASKARAADEKLEDRLERMEQVIRQQQAELEAQRKQLAEQYELIRQLQSGQRAAQAAVTAPEPGAESETADVYAQDQAADEAAAPPATAVSPAPAAERGLAGQQAAAAELERREQEGADKAPVDPRAVLYDPSSSAYDPDFPGAWHLPGTTAAMKIGGYVNLAVAHHFDSVGSGDSFIVGEIPAEAPDVAGSQAGTVVSANQTRTNIEVREQTKHGTLRAFVEGDFRGDGSSFRLRHAFGQYGWMLAGKTWSTFANVDALPDEVDFEGTNGAILQRQSQLRFFPRLGKSNNLVFSIEDPTTDVQNGIGSAGNGDFILSLDSLPLGHLGAWDYKIAIVYRDLKGELPIDEVTLQNGSTNGWGITTSGRKTVPFWNEEDFVQWQLTYGEGIGHYINDLATIGGGDAIFDPQGKLRALPVFAGFLSYNHYWRGKPGFLKNWPGLFRSNVNFSWVDIDNYDFQPDDSYNRTWRASANVFYFPTQNVRLGAEFLWGQRLNKDDTKGSATQFQVSAQYNY